MACIGILSPRRQEILLYLAVSILTMTIVNIVITEYWFYSTDMSKILKKYSNHVIIEYGKTIVYHNYFTWSISFSFSTFNYCCWQDTFNPALLVLDAQEIFLYYRRCLFSGKYQPLTPLVNDNYDMVSFLFLLIRAPFTIHSNTSKAGPKVSCFQHYTYHEGYEVKKW